MVKTNKSILMKVLRKSRDLINNGWCQTSLARDSLGMRVGVDSLEAVTFDIAGALCRATKFVMEKGYAQTHYIDVVNDVFDLMRPYLVSQNSASMSGWNDSNGRTKEEVINFFDIAITSLQNS